MHRHALTICSLSMIIAVGCSASVTPSVAERQSPARRSSATGGYIETLLHRFKSSPDAASPEAGLLLDTSGNLYGTTIEGGAYQGLGGYESGCGAAFLPAAPTAPYPTKR